MSGGGGGDSWGEWDESFWAHAIEKAEEIISLTSNTKTKNPPPLPSTFSPPRELSLSQLQNHTSGTPLPLDHHETDCCIVEPKHYINHYLNPQSSPPTEPKHYINHHNALNLSSSPPTRQPAPKDYINPHLSRTNDRPQLNGSSYRPQLNGSSYRPQLNGSSSPQPNTSHKKCSLPDPKCTKAIGVQTDENENLSQYNDLRPQHRLLDSLASIWQLPGSRRGQTSMISKLFLTRAADFYALFRCMGVSMPSTLESLSGLCIPVPDPDVNLFEHVGAAKVAHLYYILVKMNSEMTQANVLVDALVDLCALDNVVVVHGSLRILGAVLQLVVDSDATSNLRGSVDMEGMYPNSNNVVRTGVRFGGDARSVQSFDVDFLCNKKDGDSSSMAFVSAIDLLSLFETVHQISVATEEDSIREEAISVMNLILTRTNPFSEREKFGSKVLFESLSRVLQKDVRLQVQKQAVHLLFLLLNCPKILVSFCSGCKEEASLRAAAESTEDAPALQGFSTILEGLAECVKRRGHGTQELKLRRLSIKVLAFVASSGKSGFEVFLNSKVFRNCNFLELIMQALASEMDADAAESAVPSETCKERTSLIRESLILLNRLASGPAYSGAVLQVLTSSRDMVSLTIDVVNRMSKKGTDLWKSDSSGKRKAEDEVLDLARALRSRVFAYLGSTPS